MMHESPLTYHLMMRASNKTNKYFFAPDIRTILLYAKASRDPVFKKKKFFRYLNEYDETGLCCGRPKLLNKTRDEYYTQLVKNKEDKIRKQRGL